MKYLPFSQTKIMNSFFKPARISPKEISGANGKFLPKPLLFHLRHPNLKTNEPKFCKILSPKNSFCKTSSALFRHLPEYLEGRTPKEKHPFPFQKKFHTPKKKKKRVFFFLGVAGALGGSGGTIHSTSGFCWKKVRILFKRHSQKIESPFSPKCGASQSDATGVSARIRQGFLKSKRSERDARRGFEPIFLRKSLLASRFSSEAIIMAWLLSKMN